MSGFRLINPKKHLVPSQPRDCVDLDCSLSYDCMLSAGFTQEGINQSML